MRMVLNLALRRSGIAFAVSLKCAVGVVEGVAVELGYQALVAPDEVDLVAGDALVRFGGRGLLPVVALSVLDCSS
jgi:hypothetical protein